MKKSLLLLPALMLFLTGCVEDDASSEDPSVDEPSIDEPSLDEPSVDEPVYYDEPTGDENHDGSEWKAIYELTTELSEDGQYYLHRDTSLVSNIVINANVTICLNGHVLTGAGEEVTHLVLEDGEETPEVSLAKSSVFTVGAGYSVTLHDCQDGLVENTLNLENTSGELEDITFTSGVITGGCDTYGGAFNLLNDASLVIKSGAIAGNHASYGAGIALDNATLTLDGGSIAYNRSYYAAGGVYAFESDVVMNDGEVSNNVADYPGGGLYFSTYYTEENNIREYGESSFTMNGGVISGNTAGSIGGGIQASSYYVGSFIGTTMTINNGTIKDNYANVEGGGIYIYYVNLDIYNGTFTGNISNWGGFLMSQSSNVVFYDGYVANNHAIDNIATASPQGAGIFTHFGTFIMYGGTVTGNIEDSNVGEPQGSGIRVNYRTTFEMYGGTIDNNIATYNSGNSGDFEVGSQSVAYIYDGTIGDIYVSGYTSYLDNYLLVFYGGYVKGLDHYIDSEDGSYGNMNFVAGYFTESAYDVAKNFLGHNSVGFYLPTKGDNFDSDYDANYPYGVYESYYSVDNFSITYGETYSIEINNFNGDYESLTYSWVETSGTGASANASVSNGSLNDLPTNAGTYTVTVQGNALSGNDTLNDDKLYMNPSDTVSFTLTINKATPTALNTPGDFEVALEDQTSMLLGDIDLSEYNDGDTVGYWAWQSPTISLTVGSANRQLIYTPFDEDNYSSFYYVVVVTVSMV